MGGRLRESLDRLIRMACASISQTFMSADAMTSMTGAKCLILRLSKTEDPRSIPQLAR
jgi:hypothetical protein